nr:hypothetical protein [Tanacetum cinerariifolium]
MDEKTVYGWLKEQQDCIETMAQQQAAAFQAQFEALKVDLQSSLGQLQGCLGGHGDQGAAAEWFQWMSRNGLIIDWKRFKESVPNHFRPSKYEDLQGALSKLLQLATVKEYQREFEKLMNRITKIPELLLISFYISGLKPHLQCELLVAKPTTLVMGGGTSDKPRFGLPSNQVMGAKPTLLPTPTQTNSNRNSKPLAIKWISSAEREERLNKGLCFNCDNKWTRGHKCPGKFLLLMADDEQDTEPETEPNIVDVVESGDISILNSLIGKGSPRSLKLWRSIGSGTVHVLIDNGSIHNFILPDIVEKMQLPVQSTKALKVYIGSGESLLCESLCLQVMLSMQGLAVEVDICPTNEGTRCGFGNPMGNDSLPMKRISLHHMHTLLESDDVYGIYELYNVTEEAHKVEPPPGEADTTPLELVSLLDRFGPLFQFSQSLFSSPVLLVKKKDGSYHFCVDYRALNEVTVRDKFPILTADEMFDELGARRGVEVDSKKVADVRGWPVPTTPQQVRAFLGLAGYYRRFIRGYATTADLLTNLLRKGEFKWGEPNKAFEDLKVQLSTTPMLSLPNFEKIFIIETDAANEGIGAVLLQEGRLICYFSRRLGPGMRAATTYEKELVAIVETVFKWRNYLLGWHFVVRTDHRSLKELMQQTNYSTQAIGDYLQPLATPTAVWEEVSIDFITGMPLSKGFTVVLVVVDRFSKYAHFSPLPTSFNALKVAEVFVETVVKLHGVPNSIVSDRNPVLAPLAIIPYLPRSSKVTAVDDALVERDALLRLLRQNLLAAKNRMKEKANRKRRDVEFAMGDQVLVKLQPYRKITLARRLSNKLAKRYYGPYVILERVGKVAYRIALPTDSKIHPVFHVSILKPFVGDNVYEVTKLPEEVVEGRPIEQPMAICGTSDITKKGKFQSAYPNYDLGDKVIFEERGNDTPRADTTGPRRTTRVSIPSAWQKDFELR